MPRKKRLHSPTNIYHWITRGVHRKKIFHRRDDFHYYLDLMRSLSEEHSARLYHYCLMDNHVHALIRVDDPEELSKFSHFLTRKYAYHYCKTYKWIGKVFQDRYRAIPISDESHLLECGRYIERNPVDAKITNDPSEYPHSSFNHYVGKRHDKLVSESPAFHALDDREDVRRRMYDLYVTQDRITDKKLIKNFKFA